MRKLRLLHKFWVTNTLICEVFALPHNALNGVQFDDDRKINNILSHLLAINVR